MDRIIENKSIFKKKYIPYVVIAIAVLAIGAWMIFGDHASKYKTERNNIIIEKAVNGEFNDFVRVNAQVQAKNVVQLTAIEGGRVDAIVAEEGTQVKAGQIIVKLSNPMLNLNILDSEAQLAEKQNFLRNTRVTMEQEKLKLRQEKLQANLDLKRKERKYTQYQKLYEERLVSKEDYLQAKEDYDFGVHTKELLDDRQEQDSIYRSIQVEQMEESLNSMYKNMTLIRKRHEDLNIKAAVDGQLGLDNIELGQNVNAGTKIGQISMLTDYKVEALIDEHYIDRLQTGLSATIERQGKPYNLLVSKVYPEVKDKQFKVDFLFDGEKPENIRTGQTYYINLQLGQSTEAILIPRGAFYQITGGQWIFVVSADGSKAVKRKITIGRQNPNYYEVISGLSEGEQVITSSYDAYKDVEELIIK